LSLDFLLSRAARNGRSLVGQISSLALFGRSAPTISRTKPAELQSAAWIRKWGGPNLNSGKAIRSFKGLAQSHSKQAIVLDIF
jgi:hypothetical protein